MIFKPFASQEHMTDHIEEQHGIFGTIFYLILGQDIHHQGNVVTALHVVSNYLHDLRHIF